MHGGDSLKINNQSNLVANIPPILDIKLSILLPNILFLNEYNKRLSRLMKVLFALSNPPTSEFFWTRHNVGRLFVT